MMTDKIHFDTEALLRDIRIEPAGAERDKLPEGGPVWPAGESRSFLHNLRGDAPSRPVPKPGTEAPLVIDGPAVWCGYAVRHFGHFIAEQATRLLAARSRRPHDQYIFLLPPRMTAETMPGWFWDILDWYDLPRKQVLLVANRPVLVRELRVYPQGEHLALGPEAAYLDLLDRHVATRLRTGRQDLPFVYVSRAGMASGRLGGEDYLEERLTAAGVTVIRPETMPLRYQLDHYARARVLIFAEGSAAHGRQLLGRIDQKIAVVMRRKGWKFGWRVLQPRVPELIHIDALHGSIHFSLDPANGQPKRWEAFAFLNDASLVDQFESLGIPLRAGWDMATFSERQDADMTAWAKAVSRSSRAEDLDQRIRLLQGAFLAIGQEPMAEPLIRIARDTAAEQAATPGKAGR